MDTSKLVSSKASSLKALLLRAWRERWTDIQKVINSEKAKLVVVYRGG